MVECGLTEREITVSTIPVIPYATVRYGTDIDPAKEVKTNSLGIANFCWTIGRAVYVSLQKTNHVFSDRIIYEIPDDVSWGASSEWYRINPWAGRKIIYSLEKLPELPPIPELPPVEEIIEEVIEVVCRTEADPKVPAALSAYFPISIRNARWICDGVSENITDKKAIIRIRGAEVARISIWNGYGSPINLGTIPEFRDLLKELVE